MRWAPSKHTSYWQNVWILEFIGGVRRAVGSEIDVVFDASKTFDPDVVALIEGGKVDGTNHESLNPKAGYYKFVFSWTMRASFH